MSIKSFFYLVKNGLDLGEPITRLVISTVDNQASPKNNSEKKQTRPKH